MRRTKAGENVPVKGWECGESEKKIERQGWEKWVGKMEKNTHMEAGWVGKADKKGRHRSAQRVSSVQVGVGAAAVAKEEMCMQKRER